MESRLKVYWGSDLTPDSRISETQAGMAVHLGKDCPDWEAWGVALELNLPQ